MSLFQTTAQTSAFLDLWTKNHDKSKSVLFLYGLLTFSDAVFVRIWCLGKHFFCLKEKK